MKPATDAEVARLKEVNEVCAPCDEGCEYWWTCDALAISHLIARIEQDGKRMEAAKALCRAAGEANAELVVSRDVLKAFGLLNPALCAYDAALAALEVGE